MYRKYFCMEICNLTFKKKCRNQLNEIIIKDISIQSKSHFPCRSLLVLGGGGQGLSGLAVQNASFIYVLSKFTVLKKYVLKYVLKYFCIFYW